MSKRVLSWCLGACLSVFGSSSFATLVVDRAGTTFVEFSRSGRVSTAMTFDAQGSLLGCKTVDSGPEVKPRLDGPGFLLLTSSLEDWLVPQVELLDGLGETQWSFFLPLLQIPAGVAPSSDGGAWVWTYDSKLVRLDRRGQIVRQTELPPGEFGSRSIQLTEVDYGRVFFADSSTFGFPGPEKPAGFGLINADGTIAWQRNEARGHFTRSKLMPLSNGDFWRFASFDSTQPGFESELQRWTPWGMKLYGYTGSMLVPGMDITQPALDGNEVWFLARRLSRSGDPGVFPVRRFPQLELVRLGALGIQSRQTILPFVDPSRDSGALSVANGAAWVSISRANDADFVQYFTRAGSVWKRHYQDISQINLVATSQGDARFSFFDRDSNHWLVKLSPRGEEIWRVSLDAANDFACRR